MVKSIIENKYFQLFFAGLLCIFAFAPCFLFFLFFFSFNFLLKNLELEKNLKKSFLIGWTWGFGYFVGCCYWFANPLFFDFPKYIIFIPFAVSLVPAILAIYIGIISVILFKIKQETNNRFYLAIIFSILWSLYEFLRSYILVPFPWNLIGYSFGFSKVLIQTVSIFGIYIFCFLVAFLYTILYVLKDKKYRKYFIIYISLILFILTFGIYNFFLEKKDNNFLNINARIIQPNVLEEDKNQKQLAKNILDNLINDINENSNNIEFFVLPETAITFTLLNNNDKFLQFFKNKIDKNKIIFTGIVRYNIEENKIYNSIIVIKNGVILDQYDKYYLAPFGEYIPFSFLFPSNFKKTFIGMTFSQGKNLRPIININNKIKISPIICYESLFPTSVNKDADIIVNITNDIWFGNTFAPYQHFIALKFRAVENRLPALRSANSGISAYINKYGSVIFKTKLNEKKNIDIIFNKKVNFN